MRIATLLALLLAFGPATPAAHAFHDGGVASCDGCHVTHNSQDGLPIVPDQGNDHALKAATSSDVCLLCHATSAGTVLGTNPLAPPPEKGGGNFVFLLENNLNDAAGGATSPIPGAAAGHNLVAPAHGIAADTRFAVAPGGSYPASAMGCTSCHDPHGRDTFRMLWGAGPIGDGTYSFAFPAPVAAGLSVTSSASEQRTAHSAYRSGTSAWCGNCHGDYHDTVGTATFEHPNDELLPVDIVDHYNLYDGVLNPSGGNSLTAYLPEVPFEEGAAAVASTAGPTLNSRLTCLSCHRAHATSSPAAGRWDFRVTSLGEDGVASASWPIPNPYLDAAQPPLCWKCHDGSAPAPTP